jgi:hypothetical protein
MNSINFINYIDNIKILDNSAGIDFINNVDKNLLTDDNISSIKVYNNILLESKKNGYSTSYKYKTYFITDIYNDYNNWFIDNSNKENITDSLFIENGIFLNSFIECHTIISHLAYDFIPSINIFYNLLKKNEDYVIIMEVLDYNSPEIINNNLTKIISFYRDIGLNNKIIIISNSSITQNFDNNFLFVKNLYTIFYEIKNNFRFIPLLSRFNKNESNEYFSETMKNILKKNNKINIHYEYYKQKFFILEKRVSGEFRNIINEDRFNKIYELCNIYCEYNNLKLIIWEDIVNDNNSIYEQFNITNNAEIIIGYGGSMWLYNYANTCSKILIMNMHQNIIITKLFKNLSFYKYINTFKNKSIKNIYLHFINNECNNLDYEKIIYNFLYE